MQEHVGSGPTDATLALRALAASPERTAFKWNGGAISYREATILIARIQRVLERFGVGAGSRVALLSSNRAEAWCTVIAVQALGGAVCNLHPLSALVEQAEQISQLAPQVVIVDGDRHLERSGELEAACVGPKHLTLSGRERKDYDLLLLAQAEDATDLINHSVAEMPGTLNFTGGTTGKARPVSRSAGALAAVTLTILADFDIPKRAQYLAVAPISHVGGTKIVPVLLRGGTVHLMQAFDADAVLEAIEKEQIDTTLLVPTMVYAMLDRMDAAPRDVSSLRVLLYGASPMSPARLQEGIRKIGPVFVQLYGQTECYPIAVLRSDQHDTDDPKRRSACGYAVSTVDLALLAPDGHPVKVGEPGEICVRAPMAMTGYLGQQADTAKAFRDGWLHTGDVAYRDADGLLHIVDRIKDLIVTGGYNVYPKEIEDILTRDANVSAAAVIGIPDEKWGEAVAAFVVLRPGHVADRETLLDAVKAEKGSVYRPKRLYFVEALPQTALGKIDKKALRAQFWEGRARQV